MQLLSSPERETCLVSLQAKTNTSSALMLPTTSKTCVIKSFTEITWKIQRQEEYYWIMITENMKSCLD